MTTSPDEYGPRLYAYLERHWRALNTNANAWTDRHPGIQGPTVSRWRTGSMPSLPAMRAVADALGVTLLDVLVAAGIVDPKEVNRPIAAPAEPSIDAAIAQDPSLTDLQRRTLRDILAAMRQVEAGDTDRVRGSAGNKVPRAARKVPTSRKK